MPLVGDFYMLTSSSLSGHEKYKALSGKSMGYFVWHTLCLYKLAPGSFGFWGEEEFT